MLSLDFICQHPHLVRLALQQRRDTRNIDTILRLAEQRRGLTMRSEGLYVSLKKAKETLRDVPPENRTALNQQIKAITQDIRLLELQRTDIETRLQLLLLCLPNIPHQSVQEGNNQELRHWGEPLPLCFEAQPHWKLGERLGLIDFEGSAKVAGSRFVVLKGAAARLERALISFMLDVHTREHGYTEIIPPFLARRSVMVGAGQLPRFERQIYSCTEDELYLNPTAEVPLIGLHSDSILSCDELPLRYVAWTTAFHRDTSSSSSRQTYGLLHLHQFNKVELFQIVSPEKSYDVLDQMLFHAETILHYLELSYRVVALCSANLPFAAAKTLDIEVWMPGLGAYVALSSVSNYEAFQALRANIKYRPTNNARAEYVHILNASGLAVGCMMAAVLETYQQADGSIVVPKVLRPYVGSSLLSPAHT